MISKKELSYVNAWPNRTPYPGDEYAGEVLEQLKECLELFEQEYLNQVYNVSFTNNEEIEFQILDKNLCHILGVDYKNLIGDYFDDYRESVLNIKPGMIFGSYDLLNIIVSNLEKVFKYDAINKANKAINYYRVAVKCAIFKKLADLSAFNYGCINFNKAVYNELYPNLPFGSNSTRLLYTDSDEIISPLFMMGLKQPENSDLYIVETLFSPEQAERFFNKQEVIIPTQIITDNNGILEKKLATPSEKIKLLKSYQSLIIANKFPNMINIYGDYYSMLISLDKEEQKKLKK